MNQQNDSHPTASEDKGRQIVPTPGGDQLADRELLARLDPDTRDLAVRLSAGIASLVQQIEERDEEYERGWVDGSAKTAEALAGSAGAAYDAVTARALELRIEELEVQVRDLRTVAEVFAQSGRAAEIIESATGGRRTSYMAGWTDGLAGRTLAAEGTVSEPDEEEAGTNAVRAFRLGRDVQRRADRYVREVLTNAANGWLDLAGNVDPSLPEPAVKHIAATLRLCAEEVLAVLGQLAETTEGGEPR